MVDAALYCPIAQALQVLAFVASSLSVIHPAEHATHGTDDTVLYCPAARWSERGRACVL